MDYSIVYFDEVATDLKEARHWYKNINIKLEKRFTLGIKETILKLQKNQKFILFAIKIYVLQ